EEPERPLMQTLAAALAPRQLLLLLDNCEHLVAACARLVEQLLPACPQLRVLATSREPLGCEGECTYRVPSLSLPPVRGGGGWGVGGLGVGGSVGSSPTPNPQLPTPNARGTGPVRGRPPVRGAGRGRAAHLRTDHCQHRDRGADLPAPGRHSPGDRAGGSPP